MFEDARGSHRRWTLIDAGDDGAWAEAKKTAYLVPGTVLARGLTRYIALCLLAGYAWLALGGALLASGAALDDGRALWDAALHAILLGFVFSMVFGHAPVILPAVLRVALPYSAILYAPLALLHVSLALRIAGDLGASASLRAAGGAGNALAIAVFILTAAALALSRSRRVPSKT